MNVIDEIAALNREHTDMATKARQDDLALVVQRATFETLQSLAKAINSDKVKGEALSLIINNLDRLEGVVGEQKKRIDALEKQLKKLQATD